MPRPYEDLIGDQFGPQAEAYVESAVHARGEDLDALEHIVRNAAPNDALDLGAGGGHVSYLLAKHSKHVVATDLSRAMLRAVAATAQARGLDNIATQAARAESLPFEAARFDFLACRFSAHHWLDFEQGLHEARRTLKLRAPAVFIDVCSPGSALLDTHLQAVELLRDVSHVRDYTAAEWVGALARARFSVQTCKTWRLRMDFPVWTARMRTPQENVRAIRTLQTSAASETQAHFAIEGDGSFFLDMIMFEAEAA